MSKLDVNGASGTTDFLRSFDDTVAKVESELDALSKDFILLRDQT